MSPVTATLEWPKCALMILRELYGANSDALPCRRSYSLIRGAPAAHRSCQGAPGSPFRAESRYVLFQPGHENTMKITRRRQPR
jgi:hypothetical protein